jgi:serine/threonine protein kinase
MSVVYRAEDLRLGRRVALKLLAPELAADGRFRERFLRESRVAASLEHSHVIPVYEAGEAEGVLYIAMRRHCEGEPRHERGHRLLKRSPPTSSIACSGRASFRRS